MGKEVRANDFLSFACDLTRATVANSHGDPERRRPRRRSRARRRRARDFIEETFARHLLHDRGPPLPRPRGRTTPRLLDPARRARSCWPRCTAPASSASRAASSPWRASAATTTAGATCGSRWRRTSWSRRRVFNRLVFDSGREHRVTVRRRLRPRRAGRSTSTSSTSTRPTCRAPTTTATSSATTSSRASRRTGGTRSSTPRAASASSPSATRRSPTGARRNQAFRRLFRASQASTIVLSYSSNGYPDLDVLTRLLREHKAGVTVHEQAHRYHFGTHRGVVAAARRRARVPPGRRLSAGAPGVRPGPAPPPR